VSWFTSLRNTVEKTIATTVADGTLGHVNLFPNIATSALPSAPSPEISPVQNAGVPSMAAGVVSQPAQVSSTAPPSWATGGVAEAANSGAISANPTGTLNIQYIIGGFVLLLLIILFKAK